MIARCGVLLCAARAASRYDSARPEEAAMDRFASFAVLLVSATLHAQAVAARPAPASAREPFALSRLARDGGRFGMLLRQFRADEPTLPDRSEAGHREATAEYQGARDLPAAHWVWAKPYWFLFRDGPGDAKVSRQWGPEQACGEPDTKEAGDLGTAWATREQDAAGEWLMLEYGPPVRATSVEIHETFNPGAVEAIAIFDPAGDEIEVWRARAIAPATETKRALKIDLPLGFTVERLLLRLRSEAVPGWNEIDAVGLGDTKGKVHWAAHAEASSTFASAAPAPAPVVILPVAAVRPAVAPAWAPLRGGVAGFPVAQPVRPGLEVPLSIDMPLAIQWAAPVAITDDANNALHAKVAELEAKVKALQEELDRARATRRR
jgi:hypothetical protein